MLGSSPDKFFLGKNQLSVWYTDSPCPIVILEIPGKILRLSRLPDLEDSEQSVIGDQLVNSEPIQPGVNVLEILEESG